MNDDRPQRSDAALHHALGVLGREMRKTRRAAQTCASLAILWTLFAVIVFFLAFLSVPWRSVGATP